VSCGIEAAFCRQLDCLSLCVHFPLSSGAARFGLTHLLLCSACAAKSVRNSDLCTDL
jgi:hypothetical protein